MTILYCGDTTLTTNAAYLAGLMTHWGWPFRYLPSDQKLTRSDLATPLSLVILSDYPAAQFSVELQRVLLEQIRNGTGLLMFGGWESFHGLGGDWERTPIAEALPVEISAADDRINFDQPCLMRPAIADHPILADLPWKARPAGIGGLNRIGPKPGAQILLEAVAHDCLLNDHGRFTLAERSVDPLLVVGEHGRGRTAAFTSDVSPHWVGGLVDWGPGRVTAQANGAGAVEVGASYARFLQQLLSWCSGQM